MINNHSLLNKNLILRWNTDKQFNYNNPTKNNIKIVGSGKDASLQLESNVDNSNDIPFITPNNYNYDNTKIEVIAGKAKLKTEMGDEKNFPFTIPSNYVYDSDKIEVINEKAKLIGVGLVPYAHYHLNENSGNNAPDSSGNGRDGILINMEDGDWVSGKLNNCLRIGEGGDCEYIDCGNIGSFEKTDSFSIEFWIKTIQSLGLPTFVGKMGGAPNRTGYELGFQSGVLRLRLIHILNTNTIVVRNNTMVNNGIWHHVIVTYDGSSLASGIKFYVDGALCGGNIVDYDNLDGTILNGASLWLGFRSSTTRFDGSLDEIVIYEKELNIVEISDRYNSGNGTEKMKYSIQNPNIYPNDSFFFVSPIQEFIETSIKPSGSEIKYHVSNDNGVIWKYWDGSNWVITDDSYSQSNTAIEVNNKINSLGISGTFKFRALLHSDNGIKTPKIDNIYITGGISYPIGFYTIEMINNIKPTLVTEWLTFTETVIKPTNTNIKYQYSIDSGSFYNGIWLTILELKTLIQTIILNKNGNDTLRIKIQLSTTDSSVSPEINNLNITSGSGYKTSGSYEIKILSYDKYILWADMYFKKNEPIGSTIKVYYRFSDIPIETKSDYIELTKHKNLQIKSNFFQWKIEMISNGINTPSLDYIKIAWG